MRDPIDLSLEKSSAFVAASGLQLDSWSGTEVRGHVEAGADHHTPWGMVHGGVYASAVETACSFGASLAILDEDRFAVGLTNTTEFVRAHREGRLDVVATPLHQGRTGQLWQCDVTRADGKLVARGQVRLQNVDR
jgi:uncharacterized protein (TIGR00369 family)